MSSKELNRYTIIQKVIQGTLKGAKAADKLKISYRQFKRLKASIVLNGPSGIIHGNRGKISNRALPQESKDIISKIIKDNYLDFGPTLACEKLRENHDISHDIKTIRSIMISDSLYTPKSKRTGKKAIHRTWRKPKEQYGELVQFDGSYHAWLEDRLLDENGIPVKICLLLAVDDATSAITMAKFDEHEGTFPVFKFWSEYLENIGKPLAIYLDKFSTYKMNSAFARDNHDLKTQFQRAMDSLHIEPISAHSPEAKGRVERAFRTLQDRLIKEMRLRGISTVQEANDFLQNEYSHTYNVKFAKEAQRKGDLHRKITVKERKSLLSVFSRHTERTVFNDFTVAHNNKWFQILPTKGVHICKKDKVIAEDHLDDSVKIRRKGTNKYLNIELIEKNMNKPKSSNPWALTQQTTPLHISFKQKVTSKHN